jgi:phosphohistidine phosphatase SixA
MEQTTSTTLEVILMRHGEPNETRQALTGRGVKQVKSVAAQIVDDNFVPDIILCSSLSRAQDAARVVQATYKAAGYEVAVRDDDRLDSGKCLIPTVLSELQDQKKILLIAHQDNLGPALYALTKNEAKVVEICAAEDGSRDYGEEREMLDWRKKQYASMLEATAVLIGVRSSGWHDLTVTDAHKVYSTPRAAGTSPLKRLHSGQQIIDAEIVGPQFEFFFDGVIGQAGQIHREHILGFEVGGEF